MPPDETLELVLGAIVVLRGVLELWKHQIALRAFRDGVTCGESSEDARLLADQWRRESWSPTPLVPRWHLLDFEALVDEPSGARVDVLGVIIALDPPKEYTRSDGTRGLLRKMELCNEACQRCVRVTVFLEEEVSLTIERGMAVALRAAKVNVWQGTVSLSASASAVALDVEAVTAGMDVARVSALQATAAEVVAEGAADGDGAADGEETLLLQGLRGGGSNCLDHDERLGDTPSMAADAEVGLSGGWTVLSTYDEPLFACGNERHVSGRAAPLGSASSTSQLPAAKRPKCVPGEENEFASPSDWQIPAAAKHTALPPVMKRPRAFCSRACRLPCCVAAKRPEFEPEWERGSESDDALEAALAAAMEHRPPSGVMRSSAMASDLRASAHAFVPGAAAHVARPWLDSGERRSGDVRLGALRGGGRGLDSLDDEDGSATEDAPIGRESLSLRCGGCMALDAEPAPESASEADSTPASAGHDERLCAYEFARLANVARNEAMLRLLGLLDSRLPASPVTTNVRRIARPRPEVKPRRSSRLLARPTMCYVYTRPYTKRNVRLLPLRGGGGNSLDGDTPDAAYEQPLRLVYIPVRMYLPVLVPTAPANENVRQPPSAGAAAAPVLALYSASDPPAPRAAPVDGVASPMVQDRVWHRACRSRRAPAAALTTLQSTAAAEQSDGAGAGAIARKRRRGALPVSSDDEGSAVDSQDDSVANSEDEAAGSEALGGEVGEADGQSESGEGGGEGDDSEGGRNVGEGSDSVWMPSNTMELLEAIAISDFGVSLDRSSTLATPAMRAYNKVAGAHEKVVHKRGQPLPDSFVIIKVRRTTETVALHATSRTDLTPKCTHLLLRCRT